MPGFLLSWNSILKRDESVKSIVESRPLVSDARHKAFFFSETLLCAALKVLRCAARKTQCSDKWKDIILYWVILTPQTQKTLGKSESICISLQLLSSLWIHWADVCLAISIKPLRSESALNVNEVTTPQGRVTLLRMQLNKLDTLIRMWCLPSLLLSACVALTSRCFYIYVCFFCFFCFFFSI